MYFFTESPESVKGAILDKYLERGWYRMGQTVFTTNYIETAVQFYQVYWLRYVLAHFQPTKRQQYLVRRNKIFNLNIRKLEITYEMEELYTKYRNYIDFNIASTLNSSLSFMESSYKENIFETWQFELRDGNKLIAVGILDKGQKSMSGIKNFYDPDYARNSLGQYLVYLKINYALQHECNFFYPGYVASGYPKFDYKMDAAPTSLEILDTENDIWRSTSKDIFPGYL
jgi:arginine-tRNA-protein transferase